jgi:hypothetical protein
MDMAKFFFSQNADVLVNRYEREKIIATLR